MVLTSPHANLAQSFIYNFEPFSTAVLKLNVVLAGPSIQLSADLYTNAGDTSAQLKDGTISEVLVASESFNGDPALFAHIAGNRNDTMYLTAKPATTSKDVAEIALAEFKNHQGLRIGAYILNDTIAQNFTTDLTTPITSAVFTIAGVPPPSSEPGASIQSPTADNGGVYLFRSGTTVMHNTTFYHALPILAAERTRARFAVAHAKMTAASDSPAVAAAAAAALADEPSYSAFASRYPTLPTPQRLLQQGTYHIYNHPLPLTYQGDLRIQTFLSFFAAIFVLVPFCYLPSSFTLFIVKERNVKAKHLQLVSGVNPYVYWVSTFLWDMTNYLFIICMVLLVFLLYGEAQFVGGENGIMTGATFTVLLFYGFAAIPLAYCMSWMFKNHTAALVGITSLNFLFGFALVVTSFVLDGVEDTQDANAALKPFYRLFPQYAFGEALINLTIMNYLDVLGGTSTNPFSWEVAGRSLFYLTCEAFVFFGLCLMVEVGVVRRARAAARRQVRRSAFGRRVDYHTRVVVNWMRTHKAFTVLLIIFVPLVLSNLFKGALIKAFFNAVFAAILCGVVWTYRRCCGRNSKAKRLRRTVVADEALPLSASSRTDSAGADDGAAAAAAGGIHGSGAGEDEDVAAERIRIAKSAAADNDNNDDGEGDILSVRGMRKVFPPLSSRGAP
jgi:hypothetical protein